MKAELLTVRELDAADAAFIANNLCNTASEMQREFTERTSETPVVVFSTETPIAWVATHEWHGYQTLEGFTHPDWRRRGLARAGAIMLLSVSYLTKSEPVAVFSRDCVRLVASLGFSRKMLYQRNGSDWRLIFG